MMDEFSKEQKIAYKILTNSISRDKYSHAYLFETNGYYAKNLFVNAFVKSLLCPHKYFSNKSCTDCNQCHQIDNDCFSEVKHIYPDGIWIKKEQLDELQKEFSTKSVQANKKVYIIHEAEKMNVQASNSILKFLEEPADNIIAILLTDNIYQLLDTIISRCQVITLAKVDNSLDNILVNKIKNNVSFPKCYEQLSEEELQEKIDLCIDFVEKYEKKKKAILLIIQKNYIARLKEKDDILFFFDIIILFYIDIMHHISSKKINIFDNYILKINELSKNNSLERLNSKVNTLIAYKNLIKYNINTNLLFDKLIIELERS